MIWQWYDKRDGQTHYTHKETGWGEIVRHCEQPFTGIWDKKSVPLWSFYQPVAVPVLDHNGLPHAKSSNFMRFHAMQVDFEERGATIEWFCEAFKAYRYILYTSYRHTPDAHRFRVIMPLKWAFPNNMMSCPSIRQQLIDMFPGCDPSTFNSFRRQHLPAVNPDRPDDYRWTWNQEGTALEIDYFKFNPEYDIWKKGLQPIDKSQVTDIFDTPINSIQSHSTDVVDAFDALVAKTQWVNGNRNNTMWGLISWGRKIGVSPWDISRVMQQYVPWDIRDELNTMLKRII